MGRHVNHHDVQDKLIIRNKIIAGRTGSIILEDRDPATLSIVEQEKLIKTKLAAKIKASADKPTPIIRVRYTGKKH